MQEPQPRAWLAWLAVALWVGLILGLGSAELSSATTSRFLRPLLAWLLPSASEDTLALLHLAIRKAAHAFEYGVLAWLAWRAARPQLATRATTASLVLGLALAVAIIDEARQAGMEVRSGSPWDVALDLAGAVLALALLYTLRTLRRRRRAAFQRVGGS